MTGRKAISVFFFLVGVAVFVQLVTSFGVGNIIRNISSAGWGLLWIVFVWLAIYILNTLSWKLVLGATGRGVPFSTLFMVTVSGFVINYITPVIALGGEPYKVQALASHFGTARAISAVVLYRMVHQLGHMLLLLTGITAAMIFVPLSVGVLATLGVAGGVIALIVYFTLSGTEKGVFADLERLVRKVPFLGFISRRLDRYGHRIAEMDHVVTDVYRNSRRIFWLGIGLEYLSRVLMGVEVYIVLARLGTDVPFLDAIFVYVMYSLIINIFFFIPMNVGAREGGILLGLESLALDPVMGVTTGVILRVREFFWIGLGLIFVLFAPARRDNDEVTPRD